MTGRPGVPLPLRATLTSAAVGALAWARLREVGDAGDVRWRRTNYRGREVHLGLGPAIGLGAVAGMAAGVPPRPLSAGLVAVAAAVGRYDDVAGSEQARGLRGHARALGEGRLTSGMVKLVVLTAAAATASALRQRRAVDAAIGTVLVAGSANLVNLLDLRPGRAAKVTALGGALLAVSTTDTATRSAAGVAVGAALAALPADLAERAMLGDCGAGALGAAAGWAAAGHPSRTVRLLAAVLVVAATLASERVSFTAYIERHAVLRRLDRIGRAPLDAE